MEKNKLHKIRLGIQRVSQKSQGFFDGRFVSRSERDKTKYSRKLKHKNK
jgi:primosomal protein N'